VSGIPQNSAGQMGIRQRQLQEGAAGAPGGDTAAEGGDAGDRKGG